MYSEKNRLLSLFCVFCGCVKLCECTFWWENRLYLSLFLYLSLEEVDQVRRAHITGARKKTQNTSSLFFLLWEGQDTSSLLYWWKRTSFHCKNADTSKVTQQKDIAGECKFAGIRPHVILKWTLWTCSNMIDLSSFIATMEEILVTFCDALLNKLDKS